MIMRKIHYRIVRDLQAGTFTVSTDPSSYGAFAMGTREYPTITAPTLENAIRKYERVVRQYVGGRGVRVSFVALFTEV